MTPKEIKSIINREFKKLDEHQQNVLLRKYALSKEHYKQFITGAKVGKLGKVKSINATTLFALCSELGLIVNVTKTVK